jgi:methylenetetrahydrofolate reductase (NADPH)
LVSSVSLHDDHLGRAGPLDKEGLAISFEFFPPRDKAAEDRLLQDIHSLEVLCPRFVSVTYGAGGGTKKNTQAIAARIAAETSIASAAYLTCIDASREEVDAVARDYWNSGIRHIVAVRGDPPGRAAVYEPHPHGYAYATDLVTGLKRIADFEISVSAYPEVHPEASNAAQDLTFLRRKLDAGATRAFTQFFFDPEIFLRFAERVRAAGIKAPIVAGIMPITNFERIRRFSRHCGVTIPAELAALFDRPQQDPATCRRLAIAAAAEQCRQLCAHGQREFHFYTLNDARLAAAICDSLRERLHNFSASPSAL